MSDILGGLCGPCGQVLNLHWPDKQRHLGIYIAFIGDYEPIIDQLQPGQCYLCSIIMSHHTRFMAKESYNTNEGAVDLYDISFDVLEPPEPSYWNLMVQLCYKAQRPLGSRQKLSESFMVPMIPCEDEDEVQRLMSTRTLSNATINPDSMKFLQSKFFDCCQHHGRCDQPAFDTYNQMPRRLLRIQNETHETLLLVDSSSLPTGIAYFTLSHCWGDVQPLTLTASSESELRSGIPVGKLPKSFRDAVEITQLLGVSYIWIDSLCIFQDDLDDWEAEAAAMPAVYSNALCNIAATAAKNSSIGLSCERFSMAEKPFPVETQWFQRPDSLTLSSWLKNWWKKRTRSTSQSWLKERHPKVGNRFVLVRNQWMDDVEYGTLNSRAWVMQERFLSRRIVHFTSSQIFWECVEGVSSEIFPQGHPPHRYLEGADSQIFKKKITEYKSSLNGIVGRETSKSDVFEGSEQRSCSYDPSEDEETIEEVSTQQKKTMEDIAKDRLLVENSTTDADGVQVKWASIYKAWQYYLFTYSKSGLSMERDKLVALAGVSQSLSQLLQDVSVAGLLRSRLLEELLWFRSTIFRLQQAPFAHHWRAPTWSWARANFGIVPSNWLRHLSCLNRRARAVVEDIDVDGYPSGQLKHATIRLRGRLLRVRNTRTRQLTHNSDSDSTGQPWSFSFYKDDCDPFDHVGEDCSIEGPLVCMALVECCCVQERGNDAVYLLEGLVLEPSQSNPGHYERVGIVKLLDKEVELYNKFEETTQQTLSII
ncbi:heterokaryon incompatibility protein-domain-containing protein [Lophiotrema nucula]|uniref:Heterokaryon incompatibility protein-domain-containing protein n=1 Tax=Lophiotrema nucula TaxID=690887 RepID=A0A6A5Z4V6_9PLEO|nr:heterokaryon incompatibility protein-domain-containing protein [Lophiotrema nucula]